MKNRLSALDGLRGLAAFSVLINHIYINFATITTIPLLQILYKTINVGHNSVQILFVLSGFLMASIYPIVPDAYRFIQKRYSRIFPAFIVVVLYLWLTVLERIVTTWYFDALLLLILALGMYAFIKIGRKIKGWKIICSIILSLFFVLQIGIVAVYYILIPKYSFFQNIHIQNFIIMLGNITLAFPFMNGVDRLSPVFWSLTPEILFYILYPFIVIPLVAVGKKWGYFITLLLILGVTKILLDLDIEFFLMGHIYILSIATANGFVAGVTAGTIYHNKNTVWKFLSPILKNPFWGAIILFAFFFMQWGDGVINTGQSIQFTDYYFLLSSWIIAATILTAITPSTIPNKFFSTKILVFLGLISYSLYLIHNQTILWVQTFLAPFQTHFSIFNFSLFSYAVIIAITIPVSFLLFSIVEKLYFINKNKKTVSLKSSKPAPAPIQKLSIRMTVLFCVLASFFIIMIYSGRFWPTLLVQHHPISSNTSGEVSLLHQKISIPFHASHQNLEMITLDMQYHNNADFTKSQKRTPAVLISRLYDDNNHLLFTSLRHAYDVEGERHFPIGFPPVNNSLNKNYTLELDLKGGSKTDYVTVTTTPMSFVSVYGKTHTNPLVYGIKLILNRFLFTLEDMNALFALLFIWGTTILMFLQSLDRKMIKNIQLGKMQKFLFIGASQANPHQRKRK